MAVPSTIADLTTNEATNSPADSDSVTSITRPSDYLRAHAAIIKQLAADSGSELTKTDGNIMVGDGTNWVAESGATARASLGLTIGTHVQAYDADLAAIAALTTTAYGRALLEVANEAALKALVNLEIGTDVLAYVAPGTSGNVLTSNGSAWTSAAANSLTAGTKQDTTSGTSIDFTSIPAGTQRITISFSGVSTNGTSTLLVQIGDSGGLETTSYISSSSKVADGAATAVTFSTAGFVLYQNNASFIYSGQMVLTLLDAATNTWVCSHTGKLNTGQTNSGGGEKALSATLDRLSITTTNGTDAFDAGMVNILLE